MASYTYSYHRVPAAPWTRTWVMAGIFAFLFLGSWECFLRSQGFFPEVVDGPKLWAIERSKVGRHDRGQFVLIGASRMMGDLDPQTFAKVWGGAPPLQLAIGASSFIPILDDLGADESFEGIAICSVTATSIGSSKKPPMDQSGYYLRTYHDMGPLDLALAKIEVAVNRSLSMLRGDASVVSIIERYRVRGRIEPPYVATLPDRSVVADFSRTDLEMHRSRSVHDLLYWEDPVDKKRVLQQHAEIVESVERIQARGGRVIFVCFPTSGKIREFERRRFPRSEGWDLFCARSSALAIHFEDYPELAKFEAPDYSHLDQKDRVAFTGALARIISQKLQSAGTRTWRLIP